MFTSERHEIIKEMLIEQGKVSVKDLSEKFSLSEDAIRKDLRKMEQEGILKRVYGGAILKEAKYIRNVDERKDVNADAKKEIAQKAYDLIEAGDTIFLDISTTNIYLAKLLFNGKKNCFIVSNMIEILQILAGNAQLTIIGTGGTVNKELNGFVGTMTMDVVKNYHFDKAFLGTLGISKAFDKFTTFDMDDGFVKKMVIEHSEETYVMMDHTKFYQQGSYHYASLQEATCIITDSQLDASIQRKLKTQKIQYC